MSKSTTPAITATITARGDATTVPDRPDGIDAEVWVGPDLLCTVTLLDDHQGTLGTWGDPDHWCNDWWAVVDCAGELEIDVTDLVGEIVAAVRVAADREAAGQ